MGIFQSRPEEPDEWAGLPAEPWQPRADAEALPPAIEGLTGLDTFTVSIALTPPPGAEAIVISGDDDGDGG